MHKLRQILAVVFAILIASPACCCFAASPPANAAAHSCCGSENEKQPDKNCDCAAKKQTIAESDKPLPHPAVFALPPLPEFSRPVSVAAVSSSEVPAFVFIDTGPPGRRLALLQRRLI